MRITTEAVPWFALFLLPLYVSVTGTHFVVVLVALFTITLSIRVTQVLALFARAHESKENPKYTLHSIALSHFVEKVRWTLDYCDIPYKEEVDMGIYYTVMHQYTYSTVYYTYTHRSIGSSSQKSRGSHFVSIQACD